jgi:hypothetical protein
MYEGDCAAEEYDHHTIKDHPCRGWPTIRPKVLVKAAKKALQAKSQVQRRMLTSLNSPKLIAYSVELISRSTLTPVIPINGAFDREA